MALNYDINNLKAPHGNTLHTKGWAQEAALRMLMNNLDHEVAEKPEEFLEYCDWMGIPMQAYPVSLDRFKSLLAEQAKKLLE